LYRIIQKIILISQADNPGCTGETIHILTARIEYSGDYLLDQIQSKRVYRPIHGSGLLRTARPYVLGVQRGPIVGGDLTTPTKVSHRTGIVSMGILPQEIFFFVSQGFSSMERDAARPA